MALYLISILGGNVFMILWNLFVTQTGLSPLKIILASVLGTVGVIAIDGVFAWGIRRMPEKWFDYTVKLHKVSKKEAKFYEHLGIKLWKDHVLELGMFTAFSKRSIAKPDSEEYLERFILESNYGMWIHLADVIFGWLLVLFYPKQLFCNFPLVICIINSILNLLPMMILRYNLPRLERMRVLAHKKAMQNAQCKINNC